MKTFNDLRNAAIRYFENIYAQDSTPNYMGDFETSSNRIEYVFDETYYHCYVSDLSDNFVCTFSIDINEIETTVLN